MKKCPWMTWVFGFEPETLSLKPKTLSLEDQVYMVTGFKGDDARCLIGLLLRWHYVDQSDDTRRRLATFGIKVERVQDESTT